MASMEHNREVDLVVVGAGLSGLCAAYRLHQRGLTVAVLEAASRAGGRVKSLDIGYGEVVDGGAQWVSRSNHLTLALCEELGVETFPSFTEGATVVLRQGRRVEDRKGRFGLSPVDLVDLLQCVVRLDRMARSLPDREVWDHPRAERWDAISFGEWIGRNTVTAGARFLLEAAGMAASFGRPAELSFLGMLIAIAKFGGFKSLAGVPVEGLRVDGGTERICAELAHRLQGTIHLDTPVRSIRDSNADGPVVVETSAGSWHASHLIVAADPVAAASIDFDALPSDRLLFNQRWRQGSSVKAFLAYPEPWWREEGYNGMGFADDAVFPLVVDATPRSGRPGVVVAFVPPWGPSSATREAAVVEDMVRFFGPRVREYERYAEQDWVDHPWVGGCLPAPPPGVITSCGIDPGRGQGRVHWAGAEASWKPGLEGALRGASRAVREVTAQLEPA